MLKKRTGLKKYVAYFTTQKNSIPVSST